MAGGGFSALAALAVCLGGEAGACAGSAIGRRREAAARRKRLREAAGSSGADLSPAVADSGILRYAADVSRRAELGTVAFVCGPRACARADAWLAGHAEKAGVVGEVTSRGLAEASARLAVAAAGVGAVAGSAFSGELAALCFAAGAAWGSTAVARAVKRAQRKRAESLGRSLSEMLEVVSLGLRSGLSFDRSFQLYAEHFSSPLARDCAAARRAWAFGLKTREDALRDLAASYDAPLLSRVVEGMVRSLRFGSSLAEGLESAAAEARAEHKARVEERVAKAPVKMMVPTGALILPAMLLLVLGPVLLELMEGF